MKYYSREVTHREAINRFGRLGYVAYTEMVKTNDITPFNYRKQLPFIEDTSTTTRKYLLHKAPNTVFDQKTEEREAK